jgi:hypothetical protein
MAYVNFSNIPKGVKLAIVGTGASTIIGGVSSYAYHKSKKSKRKNSRKRSRLYRKSKGRRYTPHTAGKRKDTSHKRIRYTSRGQPYIILASGKARFISNKSAKVSRKRTGGRY